MALEFDAICNNLSLFLDVYIHFQNARMMGLFYGLSLFSNQLILKQSKLDRIGLG